MKLKLKGARAGKAKAGFGHPEGEAVVEMQDGVFDVAEPVGTFLLETMPGAFEVLDVPVAAPSVTAKVDVPEVSVAEDAPVKKHKK